MESTSFSCTRCQELDSHLSKDCSNPSKCVRCAAPDCEIRNCIKGTLLCLNCVGGYSAAHKSCPKQKSHADVLLSRQKYQLDEIVCLKEQVSEIAQLESEFLALKNELAEVKDQNKSFEKKLSELIAYSIFHTKNTKRNCEL